MEDQEELIMRKSDSEEVGLEEGRRNNDQATLDIFGTLRNRVARECTTSRFGMFLFRTKKKCKMKK